MSVAVLYAQATIVVQQEVEGAVAVPSLSVVCRLRASCQERRHARKVSPTGISPKHQHSASIAPIITHHGSCFVLWASIESKPFSARSQTRNQLYVVDSDVSSGSAHHTRKHIDSIFDDATSGMAQKTKLKTLPLLVSS